MSFDFSKDFQQSGAKNYHGLWIKYFTKSCKLNNSSKKSSSLDTFLFAFNYKPVGNDQVSKALKGMNKGEDISHVLSNLFHFQDYPFLNTLFFIRSVGDSPGEITKSINQKYIPDFIMRSFIILCEHLKKMVYNFFNEIEDKNYPENSWPVLAEVVGIFLNLVNIDRREIFILIENFFDSIGSLQPIFLHKQESILRNTLTKILLALLPFIVVECDYNSNIIFDFNHTCFQLWMSTFEEHNEIKPFSTFTQHYLGILTLKLSQSNDENDSRQCLLEAFNLLTMLVSSPSFTFNDIYILMGTSVSFITKSIEFVDMSRDTIDPIFVDIINIISNLPDFTFQPILNEENSVDISQISIRDQFSKYLAPLTISFNDKIDFVLESLQLYMQTYNQSTFIDFLQRIIGYMKDLQDPTKYFKFAICFLITMLKMRGIENDPFYILFNNLNLTEEIFPDNLKDDTNDLIKQYRTTVLCFILNYLKYNPKMHRILYDILPNYFQKEHFDRIIYFLPLFRSLINEKITDFLDSVIITQLSQIILIHKQTLPISSSNKQEDNEITRDYDMNSRKICDLETFDKIAVFVIITNMILPDEILEKHQNFLLLTFSFIMSERYKHLLKIILSQYFAIMNHPQIQEETCLKYFGIIIKQLCIIFMQVNIDKSYLDVAIEIMSLFYSQISQMKYKIYNEISSSPFIHLICQSCAHYHLPKFFDLTLSIIYELCKKYPEYISYLNQETTPIYSTLRDVYPIDITEETVWIIKTILFNRNRSDIKEENYNSLKIANPGILQVLLSVTKDTEFEENTYLFLSNICKSNISNSYNCFRSNVISIILERISQKTIKNAIQLFGVISSSFFSPLTMRDVIKTIAISKDPATRQEIIDILLELTTHSIELPISSYFRFNGKELISGPPITSSKLTFPFSLATAIKIPEFKHHYPLFVLCKSNDTYIYVFIENGELKFKFKYDARKEREFKIYDISIQQWHTIYIRFTLNNITGYVDHLKRFYQDVTGLNDYPKFDDDIFIYIGSFQNQFFIGDIGPLFVVRSKSIEKSIDSTRLALKSFDRPPKCILSYMPCNQEGHDIHSVTKQGDFASSYASAIPFTTTICDVLKFDCTFPLLLPLFLLSSPYDFDPLPHYLMLLLQNVLCSDPEMPIFFKKVGGFHLLSGILVNMPTSKFDENIAYDLLALFERLDPFLQNVMAEKIFFNYPMWYSKPFQFQERLYGKIIPELIALHDDIFSRAIGSDYLLYMTQDESLIQPYSYDFPEKPTFTAEHLPIEQEKQIKEYQFAIFKTIYSLSPLGSTLTQLFLTLVWHPTDFIKKQALTLFEQLIRNGDPSTIALINYIQPFPSLIWIFVNSDIPTQVISLKCICSLGILKTHGESEHFGKAISTLSYLITKTNSSIELLHYSFALAYGKQEYSTDINPDKNQIVIPELLLLIFKLTLCLYDQQKEESPNDGNESLNHLSQKIITSIEHHPEVLKYYVCLDEWLEIFLLYTKNMPFSIQLYSSLLYEGMKQRDYDFLQFFDFFDLENSTDLENLRQLISLLLSYGLLESHNKKLISNLVKFVIIYYTLTKDETISSSFLAVIQNLIVMDPTEYIVIGNKNINIVSAYANICGLFIKHSPSSMPTIIDIYTSTIESFDKTIPEMVKDFVQTSLSEPDETLFEYKNRTYEEFIQSYLQKCKEKYDSSLNTIEKSKVPKQDFKDFNSVYNNQMKNVNLHNKKVFLSFIRDVRTDGNGPWSLDLKNVHWKYTARSDSNGRLIYLTRNLNFDDHKKASLARDAAKLQEYLEDEMNNQDPNANLQLRKVTSLFGSLQETNQKSITSFSVLCRKLSGFYRGYLYIYNDRIAFNGSKLSDAFGAPLDPSQNEQTSKFIEIPFEKFYFAFRRYYMHVDCGCEIFTSNWTSYLFYFNNQQQRDSFFKVLTKNYQTDQSLFGSSIEKVIKRLRKSCNSIVQTCSNSDLLHNSTFTDLWVEGKMSNYQYIYFLNIISGRSINDISQYPIFPWIICDYKRSDFALDDPSFYRDLSKPIGALSEKRLNQCKMVYETMDDPLQRCFYRSNMSNPSCVCGYMIRSEPFTSLHIKLQDGKFDHPNRLFYSVEAAWKSVTTTSGDYRELIPQFFCTPYFLINSNHFDLGQKAENEPISDVQLPPWCVSPFDFITKNRVCLESPYVSEHLNEWIDLTFGVYQNNKDHNNVYHAFSYHETINNNQLDEAQMTLLQDHCANFGCMPAKILNSTHSKKQKPIDYSHNIINYQPQLQQSKGEVIMMQKNCVLTSTNVFIYETNKEVQSKQLSIEITNKSRFLVTLSPLTLFVSESQSSFMTAYSIEKNAIAGRIIHPRSIIECFCYIGESCIVTAGSDCVLYVWNPKTFILFGTMQIHSAHIQSISGVRSLDLCVSIDTDHTVFITSPTERKTRHSFKVENNITNAQHSIHATHTELIIVSSFSVVDSKSIVTIYNSIGEKLKEYNYSCKISRIESALINNSEDIILLTLSLKKVVLLNAPATGGEWFSRRDLKEITDHINPEFISLNGNKRKFIYSTMNNEIKCLSF